MFQFTREFIINDLNGKLKAKSNEHISSTLFGTNNKGRFAITEYKKDSKTVRRLPQWQVREYQIPKQYTHIPSS